MGTEGELNRDRGDTLLTPTQNAKFAILGLADLLWCALPLIDHMRWTFVSTQSQGRTMSNRRVDLVYFSVFLLVVGLGYLIANRTVDEGEAVALPDFSLPTIDLVVPFELPYAFVSFTRPESPQLVLSENMESVMVEVRSALLESSELVEVRQEAPKLAAIDE